MSTENGGFQIEGDLEIVARCGATEELTLNDSCPGDSEQCLAAVYSDEFNGPAYMYWLRDSHIHQANKDFMDGKGNHLYDPEAMSVLRCRAVGNVCHPNCPKIPRDKVERQIKTDGPDTTGDLGF